MKKILKFLNIFIPYSPWRRSFRQIFEDEEKNLKITINGISQIGNEAIDSSGNRVNLPELGNLSVTINGKNNCVSVKKMEKSPLNATLIIEGDNNIIDIQEIGANNMLLSIGDKFTSVNDCKLSMGKGTDFNGADLIFMDSGTEISIGEDCMFSWGISVWCSDTHAITDFNGNVINRGEKIEIGNHVWVCRDAKILKNTKISDNTVVAMGSIVTKKFEEPNVVIAGNPAKIVKREINWSRERVDDLIKSQVQSKTSV